MASNPYVNKVQYGNQTVMDLTDDTVTPNDVLQGKSFHDRSGAPQTGALVTHEISPVPSVSLTESDVVTAVNAALPNNSDVPSLFGVQSWSNEKTLTVLVQGAVSNSPIGTTGIGTWQEDSALTNPTKAQEQEWGWIEIPELIGMLSNNNIDLRLTFDPAKSSPITLGGYIIDDATGMMCIKFGNEISSADTTTAEVGIELTYKRNSTRILGS